MTPRCRSPVRLSQVPTVAAALMAHLDWLPSSWVSLRNKHLTLEFLLRLCLWGSLNEGRVPHQPAVVTALSSPGASSCQAGFCIPGPEHPSWACGSASVSASEEVHVPVWLFSQPENRRMLAGLWSPLVWGLLVPNCLPIEGRTDRCCWRHCYLILSLPLWLRVMF